MNEAREKNLDRLFHALADQTRRRILELSAEKAVIVGDLVREFRISAPAITKHLNVLESAGLLERTKQGRMRLCRMRPESLKPISEVIAHYQKFWTANLDNLEKFIDDLKPSEPK